MRTRHHFAAVDLSIVPRGHRAVVVGGSLAGMLAARVLSDHFEAVTLLERDRFPEAPATRKGLPPHQYVITRRVERAKQLLQAGAGLPLAEVAAHAGFSDQSQFSHHFKRLVGVTPGQFRTPARIAYQPLIPAKRL